ncbi:hypothetical protein L9F63_006447, partial [Diploptera punctata]
MVPGWFRFTIGPSSLFIHGLFIFCVFLLVLFIHGHFIFYVFLLVYSFQPLYLWPLHFLCLPLGVMGDMKVHLGKCNEDRVNNDKIEVKIMTKIAP